jgi:DNA-binding CsgD family transcriptional regulator
VKPGKAISMIESAYRADLSTEQWLEGVAASAAAAFESSKGALAFRYDASSGDWTHVRAVALHRMSPEFAGEFFNQSGVSPDEARAVARMFASTHLGSVRSFGQAKGIASLGDILNRHGVEDLFGVNGVDPSGRGCMVLIAVDSFEGPTTASHVWQRLAAHIAAGNRLRLSVDTLEGTDALSRRAEAVIAANGSVEQAVGPAEPRAARESLRDALIRIDKARSERADARRSVDLWRGLVAGRWSLVEHFERDGRRYYLAHKNDPELAPDRALTERERQVLGYAELGHSNKLIAYELGLSSSTVATLLAKARKRIGMSDGNENEQ